LLSVVVVAFVVVRSCSYGYLVCSWNLIQNKIGFMQFYRLDLKFNQNLLSGLSHGLFKLFFLICNLASLAVKVAYVSSILEVV